MRVGHFSTAVLSDKFERRASYIISRKDVPVRLCVLFTSLPYHLSSSHFSCTGHAVACVHPLTFHANLCLSILVCVYDGEHKHIHTHKWGWRETWGGRWYWWWWCKAVTEIEGDGVAAAGCSVHCQSGMINEWRPQLSLTFGEPHRTSAELSAL